MNLSGRVLQLLGVSLSSEMVKKVPNETKLWRAVLTLALEDVLNNSNSRNESVLKARSHDWFIGNSDDFQQVCFNAELDPEWVRERYQRALDTGHVKFTKKQHLQVKYSDLYNRFRQEKNIKRRRRLQKIVDKLRLRIFRLVTK